ncbi:MAG: hypothetical protein AAGE84_21140 [Cyanobacteria bacterium P01_G01_bin.39]
MTLKKSQYWYVPLSEVQNESGAKLRPASSNVSESDRLVKEGDAFTISLESFYIREKIEDSGNDLLVRSWVKYGDEPTAERIHFFQKNVPKEFLASNIPAEHIFAKQDHSEDNRLLVTLEITEIDRGIKANEKIANNIGAISSEFGAVFPAILPFTGVASNLVGLLGKLSSLLDKNTTVLKSTLDLYAEDNFETPLRYGAYIFFETEVQAAMYKLLELKLVPATTQIENPLHDYAVLKIIPGITKSGDGSELLVNQQLASVLSQLDKDDDVRRKEHFKFLQDTIRSANDMKDLDYFYRLRIKQKLGEELSESQRKRFLEIAEKLQKYIPDL